MKSEKTSEEKKPVCFVLMPIADVPGYDGGHFGRVYEHLLKPAIIAAGYTPVRADDAVKTDYIVVGIIQKIVESEMVLCDFSARNPNVMYELGIRHAFNKPVVLVKDRKTEKIFDIQGLRYAEYDETLRIDAVNKDVVKIAAAISETAKSSDKDLNSIVQLAGIKTAEVPAGQTISPDTKILLSALGSLEHRIQAIEGRRAPSSPVYFMVEDDRILLDNGEVVGIGDTLYNKGKEVGTIAAYSAPTQTIILKTGKNNAIEFQSHSPSAKGLNTIPF